MPLRSTLTISLLLAIVAACRIASAEPVPVRNEEGSVHGYLALRSLDGKLLAAGDLIQTIHHGRLIARLTYHFRDGSIDDDTAIFSQDGHFRLVSDHHIQKGPTFPKQVDVLIKALAGEVTVRYLDNDQPKVETEHFDLPPDLANGILLDVLKNVSPNTVEMKLSYLVAAPKPRLIHLSIRPEGNDTFFSAGHPNKAVRFVLHPEISGISGVIAPMIGKQPPDAHVWISISPVPAFLRSEQPLYLGGPVLRTELISPSWRQPQPSSKSAGK